MSGERNSRGQSAKRLLAFATSAIALSMAAQSAWAGTIEGRATEGSGTVGLYGATVKIQETGKTVITAQDGSYRLVNVPAGTYTLVVEYHGTPAKTATVTVDETGAVTQDFTLGESDELLDNIYVVGQRGQFNSAISQQRAADNLISVLGADAIGQLPDQNPTEAARRVAGVSVESDQGEGRFIVIRGMDPNLNSTAVNGVRLPSPDGADRKVALDVVSSENLSGIEITKSLTPDLDGDGIGGSVNIKTASGFNREGFFMKGKVASSYADLVEEYSPKISFGLSNNWNDTFAVAASVTWYDREFGSDNMEIDDSWTDEMADDGEMFIPDDEVELRNYDINRERLTVSANFDWRISENTTLFWRNLYSDFSDQEYRNRVTGKFYDDNFAPSESSAANGIALFDSSVEDVEMARDMKDRLEIQEILSTSLGGESFVGNWTIEYSLSMSHAEENEPNRLDSDFRFKFDDGTMAGYDVSNPLYPVFVFDTPATEAAFMDASNFEFKDTTREDNYTADDEWAYKLDFTRDSEVFGNPGYFKFGAKLRLRDKNRDVDVKALEYIGGGSLTMDMFETSVDYGIQDFGPAIDGEKLRSFIHQNIADFDVSHEEEDSLIGDYKASEDIIALYGMFKVDADALRVVSGVRIEQTSFEAKATSFLDDGITSEFFTAVVEDDYVDVLPSLVARYEFSDTLIGRAGYYRSIARPNVEAIVPSLVIEDFEAEGGNPDLERQKAHNLDFGLEWYPSEATVLSAGVFYKQIDDFIAPVVYDVAGEVAGIPYDEFATWTNLSDTSVFGLELNYQQSLTSLPAPFDGLIVGANFTYVDSEATLADGRKIPMPKSSENIANLVLGYEKGRVSVRLAGAYRSEYLDSIGDDFDRYKDDHFQWDLSGDFAITDNLRVFGEVSNVNDEEDLYIFRPVGGGRDFLSQYDEFSYTATFGLKFSY